MTTTTPALFTFTIPSPSTEPIHLTHTHPVPTFLTRPHPSQQASSAFRTAFVDVVSLITHLHHAECMAHITIPCLGCGRAAKDALKSPMSYLHLAEPEVFIQVSPVCGRKGCERRVRDELEVMQEEVMGKGEAEGGRAKGGRAEGGLSCAVCGKGEGRKCAGCGSVAYCGRKCQKQGWKKHKRFCERRRVGQDVGGVESAC